MKISREILAPCLQSASLATSSRPTVVGSMPVLSAHPLWSCRRQALGFTRCYSGAAPLIDRELCLRIWNLFITTQPINCGAPRRALPLAITKQTCLLWQVACGKIVGKTNRTNGLSDYHTGSLQIFYDLFKKCLRIKTFLIWKYLNQKLLYCPLLLSLNLVMFTNELLLVFARITSYDLY